MPKECKNCSNTFPYEKEIDGKVRNLSSREYCLECSPFGEHNTNQIHKETGKRNMQCNICQKEYTYEPNSGKSKDYCKTCQVRRKRIAYKQAVVDILGGSCSKCGYSDCYSSLTLHHRRNKEIHMGHMYKESYKNIAEEVGKCELLCENCHTKHHCEGSRGYCPEHDWESDCCTEDDTCGDSCYVMFLRHRRRNKMINELGGECEECGYSGCTSAFSFHHEDPDNKEFRLDVTAFSRSMESIRNEVSKCRLLCHNCHQELHCNCEVKCSGRFSEYTEKAKKGIQDCL